MKKLLLIFLMAFGVCIFAEEALLNGGFEDWTGELPAHWNAVYIDANGNVTSDDPATIWSFSKETSDVKEGSNALKITLASSQWTYRYPLLSDPITKAADDTYTLSGWVKGPSSNTRIYFFTSDDGNTWVNTYIGGPTSDSTSWTNYTTGAKAITAPYIAVGLHCISAGDHYFDGLSVEISAADVDDWDMY